MNIIRLLAFALAIPAMALNGWGAIVQVVEKIEF